MISLKTAGKPHNIEGTYIGTVVAKESCNELALHAVPVGDYQLPEMITLSANDPSYSLSSSPKRKQVSDIFSLDHLDLGDIVTVDFNGKIRTMFRKRSPHNSLFITDRCNSNCLMCSQPPRNKDDLDYYYTINSHLIRLMPRDTEELGITGGEPTLLGYRFINLLSQIKECLPETAVHILTNGRSFAWKHIPVAISEVDNQNMMFGIPLYSDYYLQHDYIVQARNAFSQTMMGFHNMERFGLRVELRIVLHNLTYNRLPQLAKFIYRNLPFVEHVAFMGLEYIGYTPYNKDLLWIEPSKYQGKLKEAALFLDAMGMNVSIYNLPLCVIDPALWPFSRQAISDWKREYVAECTKCSVTDKCGGVFGTSKVLSSEIKAMAQ